MPVHVKIFLVNIVSLFVINFIYCSLIHYNLTSVSPLEVHIKYMPDFEEELGKIIFIIFALGNGELTCWVYYLKQYVIKIKFACFSALFNADIGHFLDHL